MKHLSPKQVFKIAFLFLVVVILAVVAKIKQTSPNNVASSLGVPSASADAPPAPIDAGSYDSGSGAFGSGSSDDGGSAAGG